MFNYRLDHMKGKYFKDSIGASHIMFCRPHFTFVLGSFYCYKQKVFHLRRYDLDVVSFLDLEIWKSSIVLAQKVVPN